MKILIVTPLYPPDIAEPASYVKELATRLRHVHPELEVVILTYGRLPERIDGVCTIAIDKRLPLPIRLFFFTVALLKEALGADVLYAQNGPSVELPINLVVLLLRKRLLLRLGDLPAHEYAQRHFWRKYIERIAMRTATLFNDTPIRRPEILPFEPFPTEHMAAHNASWEKHLEAFTHLVHG